MNELVDKKIITSPENTLVDHVCPECKFAFSSNENMIIHVKNIHPQLESSEESQRGNEESKYQKDISNDGIIKRDMHDRMKKYACEKCDYSASQKGHLMIHVKAVHEKIRNHACDMCSFASPQRSSLMRHKKAVHDKIRNCLCTKCDFAT